MTRRSAILALALALGASLLVVTLARDAAQRARAGAADAAARFAQVRSDAERVLALRGRAQTVASGEQPQQEVFKSVNDTLSSAGLSGVRVQSVTPGGDQPLAGEAARRVQTVRITLEPMMLDELGAFLGRWRADQSLWAIGGVDLTSTSRTPGAYRATLTASAVYVPTVAGSPTP